MADLLLQKDGPVVEMGQCSATGVKDTAISGIMQWATSVYHNAISSVAQLNLSVT